MIKLQRQFMKLAVLKNINPFGLRHGSYNETVSTVTLTAETTTGRGNGRGGGGAGNGNGNASGNSGGVILQQIDPEEQKYKYYYQEQERQDELGLNWDSFKYRNYDYAIGRFMSIDPLAEKYPYNGVYNFSENRVIDGRELEGLEYISTDAILQAKNSGYYKQIQSKSAKSNFNLKVGSGNLWSSDAAKYSEKYSNHGEEGPHVWDIEMDAFNLMLNSYRPSAFDNTNTSNTVTEVAEVVQSAENLSETVDNVVNNQQDNNATQTDTTPTVNENQTNPGNSSNDSGTENNNTEVLKDTVIKIHGPYNSHEYNLYLNQKSRFEIKKTVDSLEKEGVLIRN